MASSSEITEGGGGIYPMMSPETKQPSPLTEKVTESVAGRSRKFQRAELHPKAQKRGLMTKRLKKSPLSEHQEQKISKTMGGPEKLEKKNDSPEIASKQKTESLAEVYKKIFRLKDSDFHQVMTKILDDNASKFLKTIGISRDLMKSFIEILPKMTRENIDKHVEVIEKLLSPLKDQPQHQEKFVQFLLSKIADESIAKEFQKSFRINQGLSMLKDFDERL